VVWEKWSWEGIGIERELAVVKLTREMVASLGRAVAVALSNVKHGRDWSLLSRLVVLISPCEGKTEGGDGGGSAGRTQSRYRSHSMSFLMKSGGSRVPKQHAGKPVRATRRPHFGSPTALLTRDTKSECNDEPLQDNV
jgi:hypothetical protein